MSQKASPTLIGVFTLVGLLLTAGGLVLFGAGKLFTSTHEIQLYFDKSANGLQIGSDVRFGGVRIGKVKSMSVLVDREQNRKIIPVVVELTEKELRFISADEGGGIEFSTFEGVSKAVAEGLRAGMKQQSLLTGQLYIEFDIVPDTPGFTYNGKNKHLHPVVPTIGTEMDELISGISDGIQKFNALDLDSVIKELRDVLVTANQRIEDFDTKQINENLIGITEDVRKITSDEKLTAAVDNLNQALIQIDEFAKKANRGIDPLLADLEAIMAKADTSLARIDEAAREISLLSNPRSPVLLRLQNVLQETERASRALKELSNDLKREPKALISGKATPE
ncbi:MAG: MlaD family protein [Luteolibacter sp.]|jgi:paraquat-inducible protein B|nr:MlaD family protein [Luteolibacter sp.]